MNKFMEWKIPFFDTEIGQEEVEAVTKVLKSGWLTMGENVSEFENEFSAYIGSKHAFMVSNCTAALHLAHHILGAQNGDEIVCPSLTFVASANSIIQTGASTVFADITSLDNFNISPEDIKNKISKKTKGITVVHYAGYPCDMDEIVSISKKYGLYIVEDCAHSPGALYKGKMAGNFGDVGCFSFFSNKNLTIGEGGMIVTNNDVLAERIKLLRSHGMTTLSIDRHKGHAFDYDVLEYGFNYRPCEINAALGRVQLSKLDANNKKREELVKRYCKSILQIEGITPLFQQVSYDIKPAFHIFPVLLDYGIDRSKLMSCMRDEGIQTSIHYRPIHTFSAYSRHGIGYELPKTEEVRNRILTLPLFPTMRMEQVNYVIDSLKHFLMTN